MTILSWPPEDFGIFPLEDDDIPDDCHQHCNHWDTEGECCECGQVRTPNHEYIPPQADNPYSGPGGTK